MNKIMKSLKTQLNFEIIFLFILLAFGFFGFAQNSGAAIFLSENWDTGTPPANWPCKLAPNAKCSETDNFNGWISPLGWWCDAASHAYWSQTGVTTVKAHSGTRSFYINRAAGGSDSCDIQRSFSEPYPTKIYIRFYMYLPASYINFNSGGHTPFQHFLFTNSARSGTGFRINLLRGVPYTSPCLCAKGYGGISPDQPYMFFNCENNNYQCRVGAPSPCYNLLAHLDEWQEIEFMLDATNKKYSVWINGVNYVNEVTVPMDQSNFTMMQFSLFESQDTSFPTEMYFDDIVVADSYIGPTGATSDTTPPTISLTAPSAGSTVSGSSVTVSANASDNVGVVGVQFKLDGANLGSEDTSSPYSISWNTTGVNNGSHTLTAQARDAANNQTTSSVVSVTVSNVTTDITPPTVPSNLSASAISSSQINLSWSASSDPVVSGQTTSGLAGYKIYRCTGSGCTPTTQLTATSGTSYSDTGLTANTTYVYRVKAYDNAANESGYSSAASATTQAAGGTNFALNKAATASRSDWSSSPSSVVDGIWDTEASRWTAAGTPQWVQIDLGNDNQISKVSIRPYGQPDPQTCYYANAWNLKYRSSSNSAWSDFSGVTKLSGAGTLSSPGISITNGQPASGQCDNNYKLYNFTFSSVTARYIKYEVTQGDVDGDTNGDEIEVYGATADTTPPAAPTGVVIQ